MAVDNISQDLAYVSLVVVATFFANMFFGIKVVAARKKYKVSYPTLYALESENKQAKLFNCVQRGHQNFLEVVPIFLSLVLFAGLQHAKLTTVLGLLFVAARVLYFVDYSSGDPQKRMRGTMLGYTCLILLLSFTISFAVHQLLM